MEVLVLEVQIVVVMVEPGCSTMEMLVIVVRIVIVMVEPGCS